MPTLDLALGLRVIVCATDVAHTLVLEPFGEIAGDIGRAIVAEQPRLMNNIGTQPSFLALGLCHPLAALIRI